MMFAADARDMEVVQHDLREIERALGLSDDLRESHSDHAPLQHAASTPGQRGGGRNGRGDQPGRSR
jgi:hypothetical protein